MGAESLSTSVHRSGFVLKYRRSLSSAAPGLQISTQWLITVDFVSSSFPKSHKSHFSQLPMDLSRVALGNSDVHVQP